MKTTIKTLSYLLTLSLAIIIASCEDKECQTHLKTCNGKIDSLQKIVDKCERQEETEGDVSTKGNEQCNLGNPWSLTTYRVDIDWGAKKRIRIGSRLTMIFVCEYVLANNTWYKLEVLPNVAAKDFKLTQAGPGGTGYVEMELNNSPNPIFLDIKLNNCGTPNVGNNQLYKIIGSEDDRQAVPNPQYTIATLETASAPVFIKYVKGATTAQDKLLIQGKTANIDLAHPILTTCIQADLQ